MSKVQESRLWTSLQHLGPSPFPGSPDLATMDAVAEFNCPDSVLLRRQEFLSVTRQGFPAPVPTAAYERLDSEVPGQVTAGRGDGQIRGRSA